MVVTYYVVCSLGMTKVMTFSRMRFILLKKGSGLMLHSRGVLYVLQDFIITDSPQDQYSPPIGNSTHVPKL